MILSALWIVALVPSAVAAPYAAMVIDARTGEVLHSRNADTRLHPASLTKMMTLYIAFEAVRNGEISLDTKVRISSNAAAEPPSKLGLKAGQRIAFRYLIRAAAVKSANDAATAIGEAISGSEAAFARRMNRTARALGMSRTTFKNAHGLTASGHLSTARDMTTLGRHLLYDFPQYYNLFSRQSTNAGVRTVNNTNRRLLAAYRGADGIKTGYTRAAGFNLVASAERGRERIIATVFGGTSGAARNARVAELLDMGFRRAPSRAPIRKPARPDYATATRAEAAPAAAQSQRVARAPTSSLRPLARRAAPVAVAAVAPDTQAGATNPPQVEPAGNAVEAALLQASIDDALQEATAQATATSPRPVARPHAANAAAVEATPGEAPAETIAVAAATPPAVRPVELADAEPAPADAVSAPLSVPEPEPARIAETPEAAAPEPDIAVAEAALVQQAVARPAPEYDLHTAAVVQDSPDEPEIVTRLSTSGGLNWGITVGRYPSRFEAEKVLLRTALAEMTTLDGSLRKVTQGKRGFNANFLGMTQETADLACRRLQARNISCETLGPS
ncbi:D-alanyl-D-alanine carboxypeptidase family protein [Pukyongiella litopenaei]|uniref:D-alanyl-D-alanine carboxypeptidase n=1 Tax=Pukyongiella litopenaei TaxID=2605946 RepID=A0A2S0MQM3_9RHOB|nr:D-alanyl-D-alanine carboxypeptidase family protein [Pukyongiella litopenaei]AVO38003.1 D-alanyl-D-alanine carboxypeptidase [Pukyongiella litopenaei]